MYDSSNYEINDTRLAPSFSITPDSTQAAVRIDRDTGEQARSSYGCLGEQARRTGVRHLRMVWALCVVLSILMADMAETVPEEEARSVCIGLAESETVMSVRRQLFFPTGISNCRPSHEDVLTACNAGAWGLACAFGLSLQDLMGKAFQPAVQTHGLRFNFAVRLFRAKAALLRIRWNNLIGRGSNT